MRRQDDNTERDREIRAEELEQGTAAETGSEQYEDNNRDSFAIEIYLYSKNLCMIFPGSLELILHWISNKVDQLQPYT